MGKGKSRNLTEGNINKIFINLTVPTVLGFIGIVAYNLTDTFFVGKLGTVPLAALTFTFPVVIIIYSINLGISVGTSTLVSKAFGAGDQNRVKRFATDSLSLGVVISIIIAILGEFTIVPVFKLLGAEGESLNLVSEYMGIWYAGAPFLVIPMLGNSAIRGLGDAKTPGLIMMASALTNIALDPILIFGVGPIPPMGVKGAAIATVISRFTTFCFAIYILNWREKVLSFRSITMGSLWTSWKSILKIGMPNSLARIIIPVGSGIITGMIAVYGEEAVAGYGIVTRVEFLVMAIAISLSSIVPVFVGQNFGAGKIGRIIEGVKLSKRFSVIYGLIIYGILMICAEPLAYLFTKDPKVVDTVVLFFRIVPAGYSLQGVIMMLNGAYNGLQKPLKASLLIVIQMIIVYVPLAILTSRYFGISGIFSSLAASFIIVGIPAHLVFNRDIGKMQKSLSPLNDGMKCRNENIGEMG